MYIELSHPWSSRSQTENTNTLYPRTRNLLFISFMLEGTKINVCCNLLVNESDLSPLTLGTQNYCRQSHPAGSQLSKQLIVRSEETIFIRVIISIPGIFSKQTAVCYELYVQFKPQGTYFCSVQQLAWKQCCPFYTNESFFQKTIKDDQGEQYDTIQIMNL